MSTSINTLNTALNPTAAQNAAAACSQLNSMGMYTGGVGPHQGAVGITGQTVAIGGGIYIGGAGQSLATNLTFQAPSISINGQTAPCGSSFDDHYDLFVLNYKLDEQPFLHFHFLVWEAIYKDDYTDYGAVLRSKGCFLAFGKSQTREHFVTWLTNYQESFYKGRSLEDTRVPEPMIGNLSGIFVPDYPTHDTSLLNAQLIKAWAYIVSHCYHPVVRLQSGWLFSNDTDAVAFKMR